MKDLINSKSNVSSMRFAFIFIVVLVSLVVLASILGSALKVLDNEITIELLRFSMFALPFAFSGKAVQSIFENKNKIKKDSENE